jgi:hypothetical protein
MSRVREPVFAVEGNADVLPLRMPCRVAVVLDISGHGRVDGVITAQDGVQARVPNRAALLVYDVARYHILV